MHVHNVFDEVVELVLAVLCRHAHHVLVNLLPIASAKLSPQLLDQRVLEKEQALSGVVVAKYVEVALPEFLCLLSHKQGPISVNELVFVTQNVRLEQNEAGHFGMTLCDEL